MHGPPPPPPPHGPPPGWPPQPGTPSFPPSPPAPQAVPADAPIGLPRRLAAWTIDVLVVAALVGLVGTVTYHRLADYVASLGTRLAAVGVWDLLISRGDLTGIAATTARSAWDGAVSIVIQGFIALVVLQWLYQFAALVWTGRTLGKAVLGLRVHAASGDRRVGLSRSWRRATVTTVCESGVYSLACVLLLTGRFFVSFLCWLAAVALLAANGLTMLAGRRRRSLADLLGGTVVERGALLRTAAQAARQGVQAASGSARRLGRRLRERTAQHAPFPPAAPPQARPGPAQFQQPGYPPPPPGGAPPHSP